MIQSGLFFSLGFLIAGFLALLVAPTLWRRAVFLTRKRIESAVPLTANELQADKDKLRAEHAIELRKVELSRDKQRAKGAVLSQIILDLKQQIDRHKADNAAQTESNMDLEKSNYALGESLTEREGQLDDTRLELSTKSAELSARTGEVESLSRMYKEANSKIALIDDKNQHLELQIAKLKTTVSDLRSKRQDDQAKVRETRAQGRETAELLKNERAKSAGHEKKFERLVSKNSDLEEKLARREREIARLRDKMSGKDSDSQQIAAKLSGSEAAMHKLENELASATRTINRMTKQAEKKDAETSAEAFEVKIAQMELELKSLAEERDELKRQLQAARTAKPAPKAAPAERLGGDELLREQLSQLAAEVVHMTAIVEGKTSRINKLLDTENDQNADGVISLAERIQALKQQARAAE